MPGKTILVIEDDEIQREGMAVILQRAGYVVVLARDGQEGLAYLQASPAPDLILLDMMIPGAGSDGWRFLQVKQRAQAWAQAWAHVPTLITTAIGVASQEWAALGA